MNDLQEEYGPRNVFVDRTGKPVSPDELSYSYDDLCWYGYLALKYVKNDIFVFFNKNRVHPDCVVEGKTLTKHALENRKYITFNYLVKAGGNLAKKDVNGESVSFELGSHKINEEDGSIYSSFFSVSYKTLSDSGSFMVEDYVAGVRAFAESSDWGEKIIGEYVEDKEYTIGRYARSLERQKRAAGKK